MRRRTKLIFLLVVLTIIAPLVRMSYRMLLDRVLPLRYEEHIEKYSDEYVLPKHLVMGVIRTESKFNDKAHSEYARGLMQITDDTAVWIAKEMKIEYSVDMVEDPETNIKMGCFYLSYLIEKYENVRTALAAYNAGPGNVNSWLSDEAYSLDGKTLYEIPFGETKRYVRRVEIFEKLYEKLY